MGARRSTVDALPPVPAVLPIVRPRGWRVAPPLPERTGPVRQSGSLCHELFECTVVAFRRHAEPAALTLSGQQSPSPRWLAHPRSSRPIHPCSRACRNCSPAAAEQRGPVVRDGSIFPSHEARSEPGRVRSPRIGTSVSIGVQTGPPIGAQKGPPFQDGSRLIGHAPLRCARRREGGARPEARAAQSIL